MRGWPNYTAEPEAEARLGIQSSSPPQEKGEAQGGTKLLSLDSERGSSTDPEKPQGEQAPLGHVAPLGRLRLSYMLQYVFWLMRGS